MQFTAVFLKNALFGGSALDEDGSDDRGGLSLNDVCCYMPAWFGVLATILTGLMAYECSLDRNTGLTAVGVAMDAVGGRGSGAPTSPPSLRGSAALVLGLKSPALEASVMATLYMAVVPAHLMRSVGGGFDNESVAVAAMCLTFLLWVRSLRAGAPLWSAPIFGSLTGLAYFYMAAAWGGYIFVLNMVGCHAAVLVLMGRFGTRVYRAYTAFYLVGTALSCQIPVVGLSPLKSLEQLGPGAVFVAYQILRYCEHVRVHDGLSRRDAWRQRVRAFGVAGGLGLVVLIFLTPQGYFGPLSARVRGLFVEHTKTGNPLVDSVAEHQPAYAKAYYQYLHHLCTLAPLGLVLVLMNFGDGPSFLLVYAVAAYFFSHKMVRLILLTAPIACVLGGIASGRMAAWAARQIWDRGGGGEAAAELAEPPPTSPRQGGGGRRKRRGEHSAPRKARRADQFPFGGASEALQSFSSSKDGKVVVKAVPVVVLIALLVSCSSFNSYSWSISGGLSHPTIIQKGRTEDGKTVYVDDYREAYWWLRDHTPEDSRILAWWDYGYQITGIANRTTLADGNTWNHEHIALLGKILTGDVDESYEISRHLADYALIWGGGGGDDLAKSPHLARIANSVYRDHCPEDPTCRAFGMDRNGNPSAMMRRSFLYKLHSHNKRPGVKADPEKFEEVFKSKYGKVRIYKLLNISEESRSWVLDPKNMKCDAGAWFCPGQYPPALQEVLSRKKDFAQLEDFNSGEKDDEYQQKYFEDLNNPRVARARAREREIEAKREARANRPSQAEIDEVSSRWEDSEESTRMWELIADDNIDGIAEWLEEEPIMAYVRSADGRGPMWWAFENRNHDIVRLLREFGVHHRDKDKDGKTPVDLLPSRKED